MKRLTRCRAKIDIIKRSSGLPYCSPERERDILRRLIQLNPGPLQNRGMERMFRLVIPESLKVEKKAFPGPAVMEGARQ
jgi:chorismate mutase